jgi:hypothetical protein
MGPPRTYQDLFRLVIVQGCAQRATSSLVGWPCKAVAGRSDLARYCRLEEEGEQCPID